MKLTNKHNLPEAIYNAVKNDPYRKQGHITVTTLINPPRIRALEQRHADELEEDVSDRLWSLLGQAVHVVLERAGADNVLQEERLGTQVNGWTLTGQFDRLTHQGEVTNL